MCTLDLDLSTLSLSLSKKGNISDPPPYPGTNPFNVIAFTDDAADSASIKKSSPRAHLFGDLGNVELFARLHRIYEDEQL
jgi:hypothetical protein